MRAAIDMTEIKVKLSDLRVHMPGEDQFACDMMRAFGARLNPRLYADGFNLTWELFIHDAMRDKIPAFAGYPPMMWAIVKMGFPRIVRAVCPPDFANAVEAVIAEVKAKVAAAEVPRG